MNIKHYLEKYSFLIVIGIIGLYFLYDVGFFKSPDLLKCNDNRKGIFYLKIDQHKKTASEYTNDSFKEDFEIKSFNIQIRENFIMFSDDLSMEPPRGISKTDSIFPIQRQTLIIYDPTVKINYGKCELIKINKNFNKI